MKNKPISIFVIFIIMGMVMSTFAVSPDKTKGDKTKVDNLTPPSPPSPWTLTIVVTDSYDSCSAYNNFGTACSLEFILQPATSHCVGVLATPSISIPIVWGTKSYSQTIPDTIPCVDVSIVVKPGTQCNYSFNTNYCCSCNGDSKPCTLKICP
jgi:hypothetical protein